METSSETKEVDLFAFDVEYVRERAVERRFSSLSP
jgi:hypothetical protein